MPRIFQKKSPSGDDEIQIIECLENTPSSSSSKQDVKNIEGFVDEGTSLNETEPIILEESDGTSLQIVDESSLHESTSIQIDDGESICIELRKSSLSSSLNEGDSNQRVDKHCSWQAITCKCRKCLHSKSCTICIYLYLVLVLLAGFVGKLL